MRADDVVVWGQAAEPAALTAALMRQRGEIGRCTAFVGISWSHAV